MYNVQIHGDWKYKIFENPFQKKVKMERKKKMKLEENRKHKINSKFELTCVSDNVMLINSIVQ